MARLVDGGFHDLELPFVLLVAGLDFPRGVGKMKEPVREHNCGRARCFLGVLGLFRCFCLLKMLGSVKGKKLLGGLGSPLASPTGEDPRLLSTSDNTYYVNFMGINILDRQSFLL
jgi:hypothetical protein